MTSSGKKANIDLTQLTFSLTESSSPSETTSISISVFVFVTFVTNNTQFRVTEQAASWFIYTIKYHQRERMMHLSCAAKEFKANEYKLKRRAAALEHEKNITKWCSIFAENLPEQYATFIEQEGPIHDILVTWQLPTAIQKLE